MQLRTTVIALGVRETRRFLFVAERHSRDQAKSWLEFWMIHLGNDGFLPVSTVLYKYVTAVNKTERSQHAP